MSTQPEDWKRARTHNWVEIPAAPDLYQCPKCTLVLAVDTPLENIPACAGMWTPEIGLMNKRYIK